LRGGGEYGEAWHQAGMLDKKQNVFDDFIAAAEWLVENKYTNPKKLAITGGSNGGLLVTACMLQHPSLFGAVVSQVPVTDMLRYHKFTVGRYWIPEYGNAEASPEQFKYLRAYSPLHNVKAGLDNPRKLPARILFCSVWKPKPDIVSANQYPKSSMNKPTFTPFSLRCWICHMLTPRNPNPKDR